MSTLLLCSGVKGLEGHKNDGEVQWLFLFHLYIWISLPVSRYSRPIHVMNPNMWQSIHGVHFALG
jgi:hypothetical protein